MADDKLRRNLKIPVGLHRRLKVFSLVTGCRLEDLASQILETGLTEMLAQSAQGDEIDKALDTLEAVFPATRPRVLPSSKKKKGNT